MRIKKERRKYSLFLLPLMCVTLFAGAMATGVTYSSYVTSFSGGDSAAVAKFDVDITIDKENITSVQNEEKAQIPLTIANNSEVTVEYDVVVTLPKALPENDVTGNSVVCSVNGQQGSVSDGGLTHTISAAGTIAAETSATATLVIGSQTVGASGISDLNSLTYEGVTIQVYVTQVD